MRFLGGPQAADDADQDLVWFIERGRKDSSSYLAVERKSDRKLIGFCGIIRLHGSESKKLADEFELGWRLDSDEWGNGYATEAAKAVLKDWWQHVTDPDECVRVISRVDAANDRSIRLLRRLGLNASGAQSGHPNEELVFTSTRGLSLRPAARISTDPKLGASVRRWGRRVRGHQSAAIHNDRLRALTMRSRASLEGLRKYFQLDDHPHFLRADSLAWFDPLERQVTTAFQHFLSEGDHGKQIARVSAFLAALLPEKFDGRAASLGEVNVQSERPVTKRRRSGTSSLRIDLSISAKLQGRMTETLIEAKFGHALLNDLDGYRLAAAKEADCSFVLLAVEPDAKARNYGDWQFVGWRPFLLRFDRLLSEEHDSDMFRAFRRAVFLKAAFL
jgi:hypothetical protein